MGHAVTFVRLMESAGMGKITQLGKVIAQQGDDVIREAVFANGRKGTYRVSRFMGEKTQSVWDGVRSVDFTSSRGSLPSNVEIYNRAKGKWIELFPTKHSWNIKGTVNGAEQSLANGRATITPINVAHKMDNGKVKVNVLSNQELHTSTKYTSDKGFGTIYEKKDILLGADGKSYPIYQNPNQYVPAQNAGIFKDLSKNPAWHTEHGLTRFNAQTPIPTLNRDLNANFQTPLKPIWSKLEEMFWHLA